MTSDQIQGFKGMQCKFDFGFFLLIIFVALPLQFSSSSTSFHSLYMKEHSVRVNDETKPIGQTLFVINVPPYVTEDSLKNAFASVGKIHHVLFDENEENIIKNDGFRKAYIVFKSRECLLKALKLTNLNVLSTKSNPLKMGVEKWVEEYNESIKSPELLQKEIDEFMQNYDENEKSNKNDITDDDGWTVVTKGGRKPGLSRKESVLNNLDAKNSKKLKKKELKNFYTFQIRESQMKNIAELRKNYEEAKNKVKLMKATRKFKPY